MCVYNSLISFLKNKTLEVQPKIDAKLSDNNDYKEVSLKSIDSLKNFIESQKKINEILEAIQQLNKIYKEHKTEEKEKLSIFFGPYVNDIVNRQKKFTEKHIFYGNELFLNQLLSYYLHREMYEECIHLTKISNFN